MAGNNAETDLVYDTQEGGKHHSDKQHPSTAGLIAQAWDIIFEYLASDKKSVPMAEAHLDGPLGNISSQPIWQKALHTVLEVEDGDVAGFEVAHQALEAMKEGMHTPSIPVAQLTSNSDLTATLDSVQAQLNELCVGNCIKRAPAAHDFADAQDE